LNTHAESWVRSIKEECLSKLILFGEKSLRRVVSEFLEHYHQERNHQGKDNLLLFPVFAPQDRNPRRAIRCRERLGGLLKYYGRAVARACIDDPLVHLQCGPAAGERVGRGTFTFIEACQRDWNQLPPPDGPLTVGIDGGYIRGRNQEGHFEVITGKSLLAFGREGGEREGGEEEQLSGKYFAFVQTHDEKPKRRLFEVLRSQGLIMNKPGEFLSDGGKMPAMCSSI
jgi:hypothetical protein